VDTGVPELDARLIELLQGFDPEGDLLWQCFATTARSLSYEDGPEDPSGDWLAPFALAMLDDGAGNCMQFTSVFCLLARACGYEAQAVVGEVLTNDRGWALHGWAEVRLNGTVYLCDPTMANGLLWGGNWYMVTYSQAPASYRLDGKPCSPGFTELPAVAADATWDKLLELSPEGSAELLLANNSGLTITGFELVVPARDDFPELVPAADFSLAPGEVLLVRYEPPPATEDETNIVLRSYRDIQVSFDGLSSVLIHDIDLTMMSEASLGFEDGIAFLSYEDEGTPASTFEAERGRRALLRSDAPFGNTPYPEVNQDSDACLDDPLTR
jgi:hypothetical protein